MNKDVEVQGWRQSYNYIPIFYCNTLILSVVLGFAAGENYTQGYHVARISASIVAGFAFDYVPTKNCLLMVLLCGTGAFFDELLAVTVVSVGYEIICISYICDVVTDNCKIRAFADILILEIIGSSVGCLVGFYISLSSISHVLVFSTCIVLTFTTAACYEEITKYQRSNISFNIEGSSYPNYIGIIILMIVSASTCVNFSLFLDFSHQDYIDKYFYISYLIPIIFTPLSFVILFQVQKTNQLYSVMILLLIISFATWALHTFDYIYFIAQVFMYMSAPLIKVCSLLLFSRVLGPYSPGKFFGFSLGIYNLIPIFVENSLIVYIIGAGMSGISILCLVSGQKFCETHRDYVLSHRNDRRNSRKFKIKLKRASIMPTIDD